MFSFPLKLLYFFQRCGINVLDNLRNNKIKPD